MAIWSPFIRPPSHVGGEALLLAAHPFFALRLR